MHRLALVLLALLAVAAPVAAAEPESGHTLAVYLLGAGMDGEAGIGDLEADVDVSFSHILENLELGFMGAYRFDHGKWAVTGDLIFMGLGATKDGPNGFAKADVDVSQWMAEVDGVYKHTDRFESLFGLRYNRIDAELVVTSDLGTVREGDGAESWIDPIVGGRFIQPIGEKWKFIARADVGGFGVGSDFAWHALARFDWKMSEAMGVTFGYRAFDSDYENGTGTNRFVYDVLTAGPFAGMTFAF